MKPGTVRRFFLTILGLAGVLMLGAAAGAQGAGAGQGMGAGQRVGPGFRAHRPPMERAFRFRGIQGRWWNNPRVATALKLTQDQQKAMDSILFDHREKLIDLQANLKKAELAMEPLMNADQPNQAAIEAQINKVVAARGNLERANSLFLLAIRMKLTPEQWQQIKNFRAERGMRGMHGRHGAWGRRGPGGPRGPMPPPSNAPAPPSSGTSSPGQGAQQ